MANEELTKEDVIAKTNDKPEEKAEQPAENPEIVKLKAALSRANSEAAEWKRQLREKQTEQEREAAERAEREKAREARIAELEAKERISTYKTKLMEASVDHATAEAMANNLPDGVGDEYFAALKSYLASQRQAIETAALNHQPGLSVGMPPTGAAKTEEDMKLDKIFGLTT